jgi:hypothetical protein
MVDYDGALLAAKHRMTKVLCREGGPDRSEIATAIDELNAAWDELTDCLVRQVEARDAEIRSLLNKIAELNKKR